MKVHITFVAMAGLAGLGPFACSGEDGGSNGDTLDDTTVDVDTTEAGDATDGGDTTAETDAPDSQPDTQPDTADADTHQPPLAMVVNELAAAGQPADWVELYNAGDSTIDLTGWLLRDDDPTHAYVFAAGSTVAAGGYLVIERDESGAAGFDFGLGGADAVLLYDPSSRLVDQTSWLEGESPQGASWGRFPNISGNFKTLLAPTPGAANVDNPTTTCGDGAIEGFEVCDDTQFGGRTCASFGWGGGDLACVDDCTRISQDGCEARAPGLVLNEIESDEADRIEIFNGGPADVDLAGYSVVDDGGNSYVIPAGMTVAAGTYLVLVRDVDHTFGLGDEDGVHLLDPELAVVDETSWPNGGAIPCWCRAPDGVGGFRTCDSQSFGNPNF